MPGILISDCRVGSYASSAHGTESCSRDEKHRMMRRLRYAGRISLQQKMNRRKRMKDETVNRKQDMSGRSMKMRKISPFAA